MKVTLSSNLRRALLVVLASVALATTVQNATAATYTWVGLTRGAGAGTNWSPNFTGFYNGTGTNIIQFTGSTAQKAAQCDSGNSGTSGFAVGGIIVDANATGYSFGGNGAVQRTFSLNQGSSGINSRNTCLLDINEDFSFTEPGSAAYLTVAVRGNVDMKVAKDKTLIFQAGILQSNTGMAGKTFEIYGGGTVAVNNAVPTTPQNNFTVALLMDWRVSDNTTLSVGHANVTGCIGTGSITLDNGRLNLVAAPNAIANNIIIGAGGGTITGAASGVTLSGTVTAAANSSLNLEANTTFTQDAVLYNVNLSTVGAGIVLSGAANSIASISGLGNTVSLTSGTTSVSGVVRGVDFTGAGVASLQDASTVWTSGVSGDATAAIANVPTMTVDAVADVITVVLSDAFMAHFFTNPSPNTVVELTQLTLAGLTLGVGDTVTVNLATVNGYMVTEVGSTTPWSMEVTGTGGSIVLTGKNIALTYVPEPTTATLGVLGLAGLLLRRRRATR